MPHGPHPPHNPPTQPHPPSSTPHNQPPHNQPPPFKVPIEAFRHNADTGVFSTTAPNGKTLTAKNPFALQAQYLLSFPPSMRADIGQQMVPVSMQWSSCVGPSLQDVANDAVDEAQKRAYMEAAKHICPVRETIPAPRIDVMRSKCSTPKQACTFLISSAAARGKDPHNYLAAYGLAKTRYFDCATCRLNDAGKDVVRGLSEAQQDNLKTSLAVSPDKIKAMARAMCGVDPNAPDGDGVAGGAEGNGNSVARVCVYNLQRAFEAQAHSVTQTVDDAQKLKRDRMRILIFVACILGVIIIVVIVVVVRHVAKKKAAAAKAHDLATVGWSGAGSLPPNQALPTLGTTTTPLDNLGGQGLSQGMGQVQGSTSYGHDAVDDAIAKLSVDLPE